MQPKQYISGIPKLNFKVGIGKEMLLFGILGFSIAK